MWGIQSQSALIAAVLLLALGINVAVQERRIAHRAAYIGLVGGLFFYNLSLFLDILAGGGLWRRMLLLSGVVVAQVSLRFFDRYLGAPSRTARTLVTVTSVLVLLVLPTRFGADTPLALLCATLGLSTFGYGVWRLYERYRTEPSEVEAKRLLYLVIGGLVSVAFSALDLVPRLGVPFPSFGHLVTTLYMYYWMQVVQRSRLLDLKEISGRALALLMQSIAVATIYTALVVWAGRRYDLFFFNTVVASVVLIFTLDPLRRAVDRLLARLLFRATFELEAQLARLGRELPGVMNIGDLVERVLSRLRASRRITHASVFLLEGDGHAYFMPGRVGPSELQRVSVVKGRAFLDALRRDRMVGLQQIERELMDLAEDASPEKLRLEATRATLRKLSADLSFALISEGRLLGFLNVGDDRTGEPFSSYEIGLISQVTAQITGVIENSEHIERLKERDRLSVIGEMAAGMAHEIRNPLGAIKAAAQLFEPEDLAEEAQEFVEIILEETQRLNLVLSQFLDYARPFRGQLEPLHTDRLVERVATLFRTERWSQDIKVVVDVPEGLPPVMGDPNHLRQVLINLGRNACEAMELGGTLTFSARIRDQHSASGAPADRVELAVTDTGPGVPETVRANLFIPFFTTKSKGTGLGLAISQRIVRHHGGQLRVDSRLGEGSTFRFSLAVADEADSLTGEHRRLLATETT